MSIRTSSRILGFAGLALVVVITAFWVLLFLGRRELERTQELRYAACLLAGELRQSTDELTHLARTFVVTEDSKFERMHFETLAARNGEAPQPRRHGRIAWNRIAGTAAWTDRDGAMTSLLQLLQRLDLTTAELAKLQEVERQTEQLVLTEHVAMNAIKGL